MVRLATILFLLATLLPGCATLAPPTPAAATPAELTSAAHQLAPGQGLVAVTLTLDVHQDIGHPTLELVLDDLASGTPLHVLIDERQVDALRDGRPRAVAAVVPAGRYRFESLVLEYPFAYTRGQHVNGKSLAFQVPPDEGPFDLASGALVHVGAVKLSASNRNRGEVVTYRGKAVFTTGSPEPGAWRQNAALLKGRQAFYQRGAQTLPWHPDWL